MSVFSAIHSSHDEGRKTFENKPYVESILVSLCCVGFKNSAILAVGLFVDILSFTSCDCSEEEVYCENIQKI